MVGAGTCTSSVARMPEERRGTYVTSRAFGVTPVDARRSARRGAPAWCRSSRRPRSTPNSRDELLHLLRVALRHAAGRSRGRPRCAGCRRWGSRRSAAASARRGSAPPARMCSGPVEQLRPITSTRSASSVTIAAPMSVPSSMRPAVSSVTCAWSATGRPGSANRLAAAEDGGLHLQDVLAGLDEQHVHAALHQRARLLGEDGHQLVEGDVAERGVRRGGEEARGADGAGDEARALGGVAKRSATRRASRAAATLISRTRSCSPYSRSVRRLRRKVSVSSTSQPTSRKEAWISSTTSGREITR